MPDKTTWPQAFALAIAFVALAIMALFGVIALLLWLKPEPSTLLGIGILAIVLWAIVGIALEIMGESE